MLSTDLVNTNRVYVLGHKYVLSPSQTHFSPRLAARAKMSLSRAQNIFMPANINSIVILDLNIDNYLLPTQSSISLNVAVLRTDVLLLDISVAKWSFNAPISAAVMMQKMMEALIFREFKIYDDGSDISFPFSANLRPKMTISQVLNGT